MAFDSNPARYTVNGLPSEDVDGNRGVVVANNTLITLQLEVIPSGALSATFQVFDPNDPTSPLASLEAPLVVFTDSGTATQPLTDPDTQTATFTMPNFGTTSSDIYAYLVRCTVSQAGGPQVFERTIVTRGVNTDLRKTFPAESQEMEARGWSDELNRMVDVIENLVVGGGGGYNTMQEEGVPLTQRPTMNFIGSGVTAVDDAGNSRTNVTIASGLQDQYDLGQSVAMLGATGNVVWNATDGVAFEIQKAATNVFEMDIAGRVLINPTFDQDFILNTAGTGDVSINTQGTGNLILNGSANIDLDAADELTLTDTGNWGGSLSQTGDRTLDLTAGGELYNGVTSILGALNAVGNSLVATSMQDTYDVSGLVALDVDGGNPLKFDSATPHFAGAGLFQIARNIGGGEATVLIAPDSPDDSANEGTSLVLFAANGSNQVTGGTSQAGTDSGGIQLGNFDAGFGSAASGAGASAGAGGSGGSYVFSLRAGGAGGAGSGTDAAGQGGGGTSLFVDATSGNGGVGGAGTANVPGAAGGPSGSFVFFMAGGGVGGAGSATQAAGDGGDAQNYAVATGAGGAAGAANGGAGGDGGDGSSYVVNTGLGGLGTGAGVQGQSGHIDWAPALGSNPGAVRILNTSPLRIHGPGLGTYTDIRHFANPAAIGELRLPVALPTTGQVLTASAGGATAQLAWQTPSGGGGGLAFTTVKIVAYTAVAGEHVLADPVTTGDFPVHSPVGPSKDDAFAVKKTVAGGTVTVDFATTGGSTVDGGQSTLLISAAFQDKAFKYNGTEWSEVAVV